MFSRVLKIVTEQYVFHDFKADTAVDWRVLYKVTSHFTVARTYRVSAYKV